ncbi:uncharacterized protein LOC108734132 [Agrilus planipennis]|uniref:Uncharacterized protein LOC108734132 n=1 Tax=Agrilus planipennis TaxID=224129 RepID=A0A7F5RF20_AGRPL|nr:uncharacterized protein LOC108734132 [Agrilus planipennis]
MKPVIVVLIVASFALVHGGVLPDYLPRPCSKSDPNFKECTLRAFKKAEPYVIKGIPQLNIPKLEPLEIPEFSIDRTLNDFVSIIGTTKNIKVTGLSKYILQDFKFDPNDLSFEATVNLPNLVASMEYNVAGRLLVVPLQGRGFFKGNFTNTDVSLRGSLKPFEKDGVQYFSVDKISVKSRVGNGIVKLISKDPRNQFAADLITTFFNENPRRVLDAINPIYVESAAQFYGQMFNSILSTIPASELLPAK